MQLETANPKVLSLTGGLIDKLKGLSRSIVWLLIINYLENKINF